MPSADVVVVGSGLAGLLTAHGLARRGARVIVLAKGLAATHWCAGTLDVAGPPGAATSRVGLAALAAAPGHPYAVLADAVEPALAELVSVLAGDGLPYVGDLDSSIRPAPTGIGGTRPVAVVPVGQAAALRSWEPDESLVVCGIAGFKDLWATAVAASLARSRVWAPTGQPGFEWHGPGRVPGRVLGVVANLPGLEGRRNLTALHIARAFDDPAWRARAIDAIARAVGDSGVRSPARVALPAVLGLRDHAAVLAGLVERLGLPVLELPLVPPSVPGLRLHDSLRRAVRAAGARIQLGEAVSRFEAGSGRVELIATPAAVREFAVRTGAVVLATGGLAGGGIVGQPDGGLVESVLGLPVESASRDDWFSRDPFDPGGHPIEGAGIRTDRDLRPIDPGAASAEPLYANVRVVGSLLAGQRWLRERCGDGVAIASARRAVESLAPAAFTPGPPLPATADTTSSAVLARGVVATGRS